ncbi:hypothetical protein K7432_016310 [Basidiobolus ranarum]|uniref:Uncharacterized protein n=1 Tax=Basidiobolus ranarum TaxID=34480 RepID=A0ABR2VN04_9FUNG
MRFATNLWATVAVATVVAAYPQQQQAIVPKQGAEKAAVIDAHISTNITDNVHEKNKDPKDTILTASIIITQTPTPNTQAKAHTSSSTDENIQSLHSNIHQSIQNIPAAKSKTQPVQKPNNGYSNSVKHETSSRSSHSDNDKPASSSGHSDNVKPTSSSVDSNGVKPRTSSAHSETAASTSKSAHSKSAKPNINSNHSKNAKATDSAAQFGSVKPTVSPSHAETVKSPAPSAHSESVKPTVSSSHSESVKQTVSPSHSESLKPSLEAKRQLCSL